MSLARIQTMSNQKFIFIFLACCGLLGCDKTSVNESPAKKIEKITVLCKGKRNTTTKSDKGNTSYDSVVTTSYIFKVSDSTFSFETDGSSITAPLNYEYLDQDGRPKAVGTWNVNEQQIRFKQYYWDHIDPKHDKETMHDHEIIINRISGEWIERRHNSTKYANKNWSDEYTLEVGTCENASPKF